MTKETHMSNLTPDGRRSARRCCVKGCANVPAKDTLVCDVHARALRGAVAKPDPKDVA